MRARDNEISFRDLVWKSKPELCIVDEEKVIIETMPFTYFKKDEYLEKGAEFNLEVDGEFHFDVCVDYEFNKFMDQCGLLLYSDKKLKGVFYTTYKDEENEKLTSIVYHGDSGDVSYRDISSSINRMYYRIWYRHGTVNVQYSFTGIRYSDLRQFKADNINSISLFACSPKNSNFDCTFKKLQLIHSYKEEI